jgi:hypothetical protein
VGSTARQLRIAYAGARYHVTTRDNARQNIFLTDKDPQRSLSTPGHPAGLHYSTISRFVTLQTGHKAQDKIEPLLPFQCAIRFTHLRA